MTADPVKLTLYRWAGQWGPFKVKIPCGECSLTVDVINDTLETELAGVSVDLEIREWLSEWWKPLPKGGWHAPIAMVDGKLAAAGGPLCSTRLPSPSKRIASGGVRVDASLDVPSQRIDRGR